MKHRFLYLAAATFAMVSCSQDETIDINTGKGINFRTETHAGTRATEVTTNNLSAFWASAFSNDGSAFFPITKFTKGESNYFTSTPSYNWPGDENAELTFYAISPDATTLGGTLTLNKTTQKLENFTVANNIADQVDFIYASATGTKQTNESSGVHLTFDHMLSQIEVQAYVSKEATVSDEVAYKFDVKGVKIGGIPSTGSLTDFTLKTWTSLSIPQDYEDNCTQFALDGTSKTIMNATNGNAMLIPQTLTKWDVSSDPNNNSNGAYIGVLLQITTKDGGHQIYPKTEGEYGYACMPIDTQWEAGKHYVYKLDFSSGAGYVDPENPDDGGDPILGGAIKFTVEVNEWTPNGGQEVPVDME